MVANMITNLLPVHNFRILQLYTFIYSLKSKHFLNFPYLCPFQAFFASVINHDLEMCGIFHFFGFVFVTVPHSHTNTQVNLTVHLQRSRGSIEAGLMSMTR